MACCTYAAMVCVEKHIASVSELEIDYSIMFARENGKQEANLNAGYHCDPQEINLLHPVWKEDSEEEVDEVSHTQSSEKRVTFGKKILQKVGWDSHGSIVVKEQDTDFVERGERPLCKVVKIVEASIGCSKTIIPILVGIKDKDFLQEIDDRLKDIIDTLEAGQNYSIPNASSITIKPGFHAIDLISKAHVIFQYFAGIPPLPVVTHKFEENKITSFLETRSPPKLQRLASRSIYCCPNRKI